MHTHKDPRNVNYFLVIYLILYLALSFAGSSVIDISLLSTIIQFLPLVLGIFFLLITRQPLLSSVNLRRIHPLTVPCAVLFTFCLWPLLTLVNLLSMLFSENMIQNTVTGTVSSHGLLYSLATLSLIPAMIEEFTFRGIVYGQYRAGSPLKAVLLSSLCFGLMHMNFNQFCYAFVIGVFLALAVEASGSLLASMVTHAVFNGISVVLVYVRQYIPADVTTDSESTRITAAYVMDLLPSYAPLAAGGCVLAFLLLHIMAKLNHREFRLFRGRGRTGQKLTNLWFYCFVVICLIVCLLLEFLYQR